MEKSPAWVATENDGGTSQKCFVMSIRANTETTIGIAASLKRWRWTIETKDMKLNPT